MTQMNTDETNEGVRSTILLPISFVDAEGQEWSIRILDEDDYWLCKRHPDGPWVTSRSLTPQQVQEYYDKIR